MKLSLCVLVIARLCSVHMALAADSTSQEQPVLLTRMQLTESFESSKNKTEYTDYVAAFDQWRQNFKHEINDRAKCGTLNGTVDLYAVVSPHGVIQQVDVVSPNTKKSSCVQKAYLGIQLKPPPFTPFVLHITTDASPFDVTK